MTNPMIELAERVEAARFPATGEISVAMELVEIRSAISHLLFGRAWDAYSPDWLGSLDAAVALVPDGHKWAVYGGGFASVERWDGTEVEEEVGPDCVKAATPALALTAAALRSRAVKENSDG